MSKQQPSDLRKEYGAPFAIFSPEEGNRYTDLISRHYTPPRSLDFDLIQNPKLRKAVESHCRTLGFNKIVQLKHEAYEELMLQFYTTLNFSDAGFSFRVNGKTATVKPLTLRCIFGFPKGGHKTVPEDFDPAGFWREIFDSGEKLIKDPDLLIMHQILSRIFFGRDDDVVTLNDLFYLSCLCCGVRVSSPCFLVATFKSVVTEKRAHICLGNFITAIALHFGMFDPAGMKALPTRALGLSTKEDVYSSSSSDEAEDDTNNPVVIDDDVDSWMLISREMEKMETRMNDGFNDLQAGIDGLEKKVDSICDRFQTFQLEWADVRQRESNDCKTMIDKLSMTVEKIEEGWLAKISSLNVVDLANLVNDMSDLGIGENLKVPPKNDVDVHDHIDDDFPAVHSSNSNGTKGRLSKNDDINSPETQTSCHNLPQPASDESARDIIGTMPDVDAHDVDDAFPNGSKRFSKNNDINSPETQTSCHNLPQPASDESARDIIEILDSDDETKSNGEGESSKRVPNSDDINYLIHKNKRRRNETNQTMQNLLELRILRWLGK